MSRPKYWFIFCIVFIYIINFACVKNNSDITMNETIKVTTGDNSIANDILASSDASVWMGTYNHELYFCPFKGKLKGWLCKFEEDGIIKIINLDPTHVFYGIVGPYIYYSKQLKEGYGVACYDFCENSISIIYSDVINPFLPPFFEDQSIYVPVGYDSYQPIPEYAHIKEKNVIEITTEIGGKTIGNMAFYMPIETKTSVIPNINRAIIPTKYGKIVHWQDHGDMLYLVDIDNQIVKLFDVPCLCATSAITVVNDSVYLSFIRYEKHGELGMKRFEDDTLEGMYRISLTDYSIEKLNSCIYNGLYYFGDAYIYACDKDGRVYCLNLDGSVKDILYR